MQKILLGSVVLSLLVSCNIGGMSGISGNGNADHEGTWQSTSIKPFSGSQKGNPWKSLQFTYNSSSNEVSGLQVIDDNDVKFDGTVTRNFNVGDLLQITFYLNSNSADKYVMSCQKETAITEKCKSGKYISDNAQYVTEYIYLKKL